MFFLLKLHRKKNETKINIYSSKNSFYPKNDSITRETRKTQLLSHLINNIKNNSIKKINEIKSSLIKYLINLNYF